MTTDNRLVVSRSSLRVPIALAAVGAIALVVGLLTDSERTWLNLLVDGFYVLSLGVSGVFFIAAQRLASSHWWTPIRRIPEAFSLLLPAGAVLMIVLMVVAAFSGHHLYPWLDPHSAEMTEEHPLVRAGRFTYLAPAFVYVRMAVIVALWTFFALRMRKISLAGDASRQAGLAAFVKLFRYSGGFAPLFAVTFAAAAYDFLISLEPKWFSTMFSVYVFAGCFIQGIAAIALTAVTLKRKQLLGSGDKVVDTHVIQTLGTMTLAFSTFWGYIWVCQYLLIWYGNIPEEAVWYLERSTGGWLPLLLASFIVSWIIPFFTLLPLSSKRSLRVMSSIAVLVLLGRWLDLYILVMPSKWKSPHFGLLEIAMAAGTAGLIYLIVVRGLSRAPLIPPHDPVLAARRGHGHGHGGHAQGEAS
jgi:hypothetical protein